MTDDEITRLRKLARAATPGPWDVRISHDEERGSIDPLAYESPGYYDNLGIYAPSVSEWPIACGEYSVSNGPDLAYIAAVSPDVVLALLAEVDRQQRAVPSADHAAEVILQFGQPAVALNASARDLPLGTRLYTAPPAPSAEPETSWRDASTQALADLSEMRLRVLRQDAAMRQALTLLEAYDARMCANWAGGNMDEVDRAADALRAALEGRG
jgi:hypothetical protein